VLKKSKLRW